MNTDYLIEHIKTTGVVVISSVVVFSLCFVLVTNSGWRFIKVGDTVVINETGKLATVVAADPPMFVLRVDNGSDATVRFSEVRFHKDEITTYEH